MSHSSNDIGQTNGAQAAYQNFLFIAEEVDAREVQDEVLNVRTILEALRSEGKPLQPMGRDGD